MKRKTLDDWKQLIEEQQKSGLSIVAFCRENKLPTSNFYKYRGQLQAQDRVPVFVKATPPVRNSANCTITLLYGPVQLKLSTACEPAWIADVEKALQS